MDMGIGRTTRLVAVGACRYIRHPLYCSLLALTLCAFLKRPLAPASIALALGGVWFLFATAICEEQCYGVSMPVPSKAQANSTRQQRPFQSGNLAVNWRARREDREKEIEESRKNAAHQRPISKQE
jgi:protein-S-isoprenylcysteine O-methyltransferase Ste14